MVIYLTIATNSIIELVGKKQVEDFAKRLTRFTTARYTLVPVLAVLFLGNLMYYTFGRFVEEKYKPTYYNSCVSFLRPVTGLFPYANPGKLFVYIRTATGITKLNPPLGDLAVYYSIIGIIVILIRGVLTEKIYSRLTSKFTKERKDAEK